MPIGYNDSARYRHYRSWWHSPLNSGPLSDRTATPTKLAKSLIGGVLTKLATRNTYAKRKTNGLACLLSHFPPHTEAPVENYSKGFPEATIRKRYQDASTTICKGSHSCALVLLRRETTNAPKTVYAGIRRDSCTRNTHLQPDNEDTQIVYPFALSKSRSQTSSNSFTVHAVYRIHTCCLLNFLRDNLRYFTLSSYFASSRSHVTSHYRLLSVAIDGPQQMWAKWLSVECEARYAVQHLLGLVTLEANLTWTMRPNYVELSALLTVTEDKGAAVTSTPKSQLSWIGSDERSQAAEPTGKPTTCADLDVTECYENRITTKNLKLLISSCTPSKVASLIVDTVVAQDPDSQSLKPDHS
ncbi:hypothetical protein CLF_103907 [Clonorchis sinensis]|uniref:Uncharacterized protein n=1 Tax=Clonorchis sinensis TaxID=79923 RepID=G7YAL5_CLOSI|nr:hypothetical protein CLF_103907 [Clonorchis sinensis]